MVVVSFFTTTTNEHQPMDFSLYHFSGSTNPAGSVVGKCANDPEVYQADRELIISADISIREKEQKRERGKPTFIHPAFLQSLSEPASSLFLLLSFISY